MSRRFSLGKAIKANARFDWLFFVISFASLIRADPSLRILPPLPALFPGEHQLYPREYAVPGSQLLPGRDADRLREESITTFLLRPRPYWCQQIRQSKRADDAQAPWPTRLTFHLAYSTARQPLWRFETHPPFPGSPQ